MSLHKHPNIPSLDGLRAVSIAIVFAAHARVSDMIPGGFGVTVFFFLSGFLITTLFFGEAERHGSINLKAFYVRRLFRLSPPLLVTLAVCYGLLALGLVDGEFDLTAVLAQIFYVFNYYRAYVPDSVQGVNGLNILWSLSVEEHFYLIYPAIFLLFLRGRITVGHICAMLVFFLAWRWLRFVPLEATTQQVYVSTDTRFDSILYGCLLAMMNARGLSERVFPQGALGRTLLMAVALAVLIFTFVWQDSTFRMTLRYTLQGLALMPLFYYAVSRPDLPYFRPLNWKPLRWIGIYSYSIYLIHLVVIAMLVRNGWVAPGGLGLPLISAAISVAYAAALYHGVERPIKHLRDRWMRRPVPSTG